jgi:trehalose 6-phosphate phosphatase
LKHLFTPGGEHALNQVLALKPLLAFDFDGTLAPIVAQPEDARVSTAVAQQLKQLAQLRPVAIITGRSISDVTPRLGFTAHYVIGNHGAEDLWMPKFQTDPQAWDQLREHLHQHHATLQKFGVTLEDKNLSLALHYRLARDRTQALDCIERTLDGWMQNSTYPEARFKTFGGKCVVNVISSQAPDKGDALHRLVQRTSTQAAVFVGDDLNDESAFEQAPQHWLTLRIGRDDPRSKARYFLDSHGEVALFLQRMIEQLQRG